MRASQRRRIVGVPNDVTNGGLNQTKNASPMIQVEPPPVPASPPSSRRNSEYAELTNVSTKEASLAALSVSLNLRRRRRMSANTEQIQQSQNAAEEEPTTYFHKVFDTF